MGAGIIFKGTGFYETDYKNKSPEKKEGNSESKEKGTAKEKESKSKETSSTKESKLVPKKESKGKKKPAKANAK